VVCNMLGYTDAVPIVYLDNRFDTPETRRLPYLLGNVDCTGQEADIWDCPSGDVPSYCKPGTDNPAGVSCVDPPSTPTHTHTLHKDYLTADAARASCTSHGGRLAMPKTRAQLAAFMSVVNREAGNDDPLVWIDIRRNTSSGVWEWGDGKEVMWADWGRGQPEGRGDCGYIWSSYGGWWDDTCDETWWWYMCQAAPVRLVGGHDSRSGNVVLVKDGKEGLICSNEWSLRDAKVVCNMLGYTDAAPIAYSFNHFDNPETRRLPYLLDQVDCTGQEADIWDCPTGGFWSGCTPGSEMEAGVSCVAPPSPATHTYTLHKDEINPDAAIAACNSHGGRLAMPKTPAELAAFMYVVYSETGGTTFWYNIWIDIRKTSSGVWEWGDETQVLWADWVTGSPFGYGDCGVISHYGGWMDRPCDEQLRYMCQADV